MEKEKTILSHYNKAEESDRKWKEKLEYIEMEYKERFKRESKKARDQLDMKDDAYRALQQKLHSANQKNLLLNSLLDKTKRPSSEVTTFNALNAWLHKLSTAL